MTKSKIKKAVHAHTDLNTFAAVVTLLEGGHLYGGAKSQRAAIRIIGICKKEQQRCLREYEQANNEGCK